MELLIVHILKKTGSIKSISSNDFTNATNLNITSPFFN